MLWKRLLVGIILVVSMLAAAAPAEAGYGPWGWGYGGWSSCSPCYSSCWSGCYASTYTTCSVCHVDPCGCSGWYAGSRRGPIRRLLFGPYRWYGAGWGYQYNGCYWDAVAVTTVPVCEPSIVFDSDDVGTTISSQEPSYDGPAMDGSMEESTWEPTRAAPLTPQPNTLDVPDGSMLPGPLDGGSTAPRQGSSTRHTRATSGLLTIYVPYGANVYVNGMKTKTVGSKRTYVSRGLRPGYRYKYTVRAELVRDDKMVRQTREIYLTGGDDEALAFSFRPDADTSIASAR